MSKEPEGGCEKREKNDHQRVTKPEGKSTKPEKTQEKDTVRKEPGKGKVGRKRIFGRGQDKTEGTQGKSLDGKLGRGEGPPWGGGAHKKKKRKKKKGSSD